MPPKKVLKLPRRGTYRPSHKATFIGLAVVALILAINAGAIVFVLKRSQDADKSQLNENEVTLSSETLDKLGVSRNPVGTEGTELTIGPATTFVNKVTIGKDVSVGGQLTLNSKFSASDASLTKLQAGDTSLNKLTVNTEALINTLNIAKDLTIIGTTKVQGPVTFGQLVTVNNNLNVAGSLAIGGTLTTRNFQASSLISDTTLTIGGHVITRGSAPGVSGGGAVGSNGTVSISGSDAAGTIAINTGVGAGNGLLASVSFHAPYNTTPRVVVTAVGPMGPLYISRSSSGFSVSVIGAVAPGGYAIDYIVMQ